MNSAVTLAFLSLGRISLIDAVSYILDLLHDTPTIGGKLYE